MDNIVYIVFGTLLFLAFVMSVKASIQARLQYGKSNNPLPVYLGLRQQALEMFANDNLTDREVWGALMELELRGHTATLVAFKTGDASIYYSTGGGVLGGGAHAPVRKAVQDFLAVAQTYLPKMERVTEYPLPSAGKVRFYVMNPQGIFTIEADFQALHNRAHELYAFHAAGQDVITQLRIVSQNPENNHGTFVPATQ